MTDRPSSTKLRRQCFDANKYQDALTGRIMLTCHLCGLPIDPVREDWEAEHVVRRAASNDDSVANLKPAHVSCHAVKTAQDVRENAKGKRASAKHFGIERKRSSFRKKPAGAKFDWSQGRYVMAGDDE